VNAPAVLAFDCEGNLVLRQSTGNRKGRLSCEIPRLATGLATPRRRRGDDLRERAHGFGSAWGACRWTRRRLVVSL